MASRHYLLASNVPLQLHWSERILTLIQDYTMRSASSAGIDASKYEDEDLKAMKQWMTTTVTLMKPLIKLIKEDTGQLPVVGDTLSCAPGYTATIEKRSFYCPENEPDTYGVGYFLETEAFDYLAQLDNIVK